MNDTVQALLERMRRLQEELEAEINRRREDLRFEITGRRIVFEAEMLERQRAFRAGLLRYLREARLAVVLTAPLIYSLIIPFVLMDLWITLYQAVCFPIYGIPKVRRSDYLAFDRVHLPYLNAIERLNCGYCSYGNGVAAYLREVAARTEQYWCPIKHARKIRDVHARYPLFTDYGDGERYRKELDKLRKSYY
ncbi:hypothetical protein QVG61_04375 [Thiohalobacter sp. IOR34]|uniref:hypothetical protein n=1 Tax=Thiohalobacter sp. IOR34 TaxID=3057176 RepID=UPI0025B03B7E|nr:hypothetical protein [Thiohalobacter sp. IOR34]WJW76336.1 hypothetical protein QVG61_04375 [Thiohalobacter sp. IOR34]